MGAVILYCLLSQHSITSRVFVLVFVFFVLYCVVVLSVNNGYYFLSSFRVVVSVILFPANE
jgi:hypothetical protein